MSIRNYSELSTNCCIRREEKKGKTRYRAGRRPYIAATGANGAVRFVSARNSTESNRTQRNLMELNGNQWGSARLGGNRLRGSKQKQMEAARTFYRCHGNRDAVGCLGIERSRQDLQEQDQDSKRRQRNKQGKVYVYDGIPTDFAVTYRGRRFEGNSQWYEPSVHNSSSPSKGELLRAMVQCRERGKVPVATVLRDRDFVIVRDNDWVIPGFAHDLGRRAGLGLSGYSS